MKKNLYLFLLIAICAVLTSSCAKENEVNQEIVELSDVRVNNENSNEVVMTDSDVEKRLPPVPTFGEQKSETSYVDKDGSNIRISYDGQGTRIETRYFFNHPNLKMLTVTISNDGTIQEGIVFGHNNEKKKLPPDWLDKALTASGNDIAYKVGITTAKIVTTNTKAQPNQVYTEPKPQPVVVERQPRIASAEEPNIETEPTPPVSEKNKDNQIHNQK